MGQTRLAFGADLRLEGARVGSKFALAYTERQRCERARILHCGHTARADQCHPERLALLRCVCLIASSIPVTYALRLGHHAVPPEIEHSLVWTKLAIMHPSLIDPSIAARVDQDGLWGFTGETSPPPSPSAVADSLPALAEWGVTMEKLIRSPRPSADEQVHLARACGEVDTYIRRRWEEAEWETAWFVNPPVSRYGYGCRSSC